MKNVLLSALITLIFIIGCAPPEPVETCEQTGIEGVHIGGDNFCRQKGFDSCKAADLVVEMKHQDPIWVPIGCSTPHSDQLWEETVDRLGKGRVEDGFYIFECCKKE